MYHIKTFNKISPVGLNKFDPECYAVGDDEQNEDGILVRSAKLHDYAFPENLLAIARAGVGVNNIPLDRCSETGIAVFNTPGANANAVAELVICGLMLGSRNVAGGIDWARTLDGQGAEVAKLVEKGKAQFAGPEVRGKTLGVIGLGAIGAIVANAAAQGLGMNVIGYDPFISVESAWSLSRAIKRSSSVDEIYRTADYITVHVPLTDATRGMLGESAIAQMKDGVHLLNFSRAELADAESLAAALESGKVASYVTDFPTQDVLRMKNAVAIPHLGASTPESEVNCADMAARELRDYLEDGQIRNSVNFPEILLGHSEGVRVLIIHENEPGMVSAISAAIGARKININNMLNKSRRDMAVTVLELDREPDDMLQTQLKALPGVIRLRLPARG